MSGRDPCEILRAAIEGTRPGARVIAFAADVRDVLDELDKLRAHACPKARVHLNEYELEPTTAYCCWKCRRIVTEYQAKCECGGAFYEGEEPPK